MRVGRRNPLSVIAHAGDVNEAAGVLCFSASGPARDVWSCALFVTSPPLSLLSGAVILHYFGISSISRAPPSLLGGSRDWSIEPTVTESFAPPSKLGGGVSSGSLRRSAESPSPRASSEETNAIQEAQVRCQASSVLPVLHMTGAADGVARGHGGQTRRLLAVGQFREHLIQGFLEHR